MDFKKIKEIEDKIKRKKEKLNKIKDYRAINIIRLEIQIEQIKIKIERLKQSLVSTQYEKEIKIQPQRFKKVYK